MDPTLVPTRIVNGTVSKCVKQQEGILTNGESVTWLAQEILLQSDVRSYFRSCLKPNLIFLWSVRLDRTTGECPRKVSKNSSVPEALHWRNVHDDCTEEMCTMIISRADILVPCIWLCGWWTFISGFGPVQSWFSDLEFADMEICEVTWEPQNLPIGRARCHTSLSKVWLGAGPRLKYLTTAWMTLGWVLGSPCLTASISSFRTTFCLRNLSKSISWTVMLCTLAAIFQKRKTLRGHVITPWGEECWVITSKVVIL